MDAPVLPRLDSIGCFVVTGEEDHYAPPDVAEAFARSLPAGTRFEVLRECGHLPMLEQPGAFSRLMTEFLAHAGDGSPSSIS